MQLLKITTNPIQYELRVERPKLEIKQSQPSVTRTTEPGQLTMQSKNISVRIDTVDMKNSIGLKTVSAASQEEAQRGKQAAKESTAQYVEMGYQMMQIHKNADISDIMAQYFYPSMPMLETHFMPAVGPNISWESGSLSIDYTPGKIFNEWHVLKNTMEYIPGKISMNITQYPSVSIEYLGDPIYAPPSANPNYEE